MNKWMIMLSSLLIFCSFVFQTNKSFKTILLKDKNVIVKVDEFENIYVINKNEILKYNSSGNLVKSFSTKRYGSIDFVDVTNPLKILLYNKDFQQILFLDNQLTASSNMISLEDLGLEQTSLECNTANNSFWLYNKQNNSLLRYSEKSKQLVKIENITRILNVELKPNFMLERNNYLYLNCPNEGILVFDIYGSFLKTIPITHASEFEILNNRVIYFTKKTIHEYDSQTFGTATKDFSDTLLRTVYWQGENFFKVFQDSIVKEPVP